MKAIMTPILIILVVASILFLAFIPIQNSTWANNIRSRPVVEESSDPFLEDGDTSIIALIIRPIDALLKVALFMGIPGWITWRISRKKNRRTKKSTNRLTKHELSS